MNLLRRSQVWSEFDTKVRLLRAIHAEKANGIGKEGGAASPTPAPGYCVCNTLPKVLRRFAFRPT
jgi:hypothetical protein